MRSSALLAAYETKNIVGISDYEIFEILKYFVCT